MTKRILFLSLLPLFAAGSLSAAITYSGVQNIPIPTTFSGVSLTLDRADASVFTTDTSATNTTGAGWDLNFFLGGAGIANNVQAQPVREDSGDNLSFIHNLTPGTTVDGTSTVAGGFGGSGFPNEHIGGGANQFTNATAGYFGFVLDAGTTGPLYGWMKILPDNSGTPGVIESWAFETTPDTPILVGAVPEPSTFVLLAGVIGGALLRRRRRS